MASATSWFSPERPFSLRWRIALAMALLGLVVVVAQAAAYLYIVDQQEDDFIDGIIEQQIDYSIGIWARSPQAARPNTPDMHLYVVPSDAPPAEPVPSLFAYLPEGNHEVFERGKEFHVAVRDRAGTRFILAYDVEDHEARWDAFLLLSSGVLAVFCVLLTVAGYFLASRLAGRLERLATKVAAGEPELLEDDMEPELGLLAEALEADHRRQAQAMARERAFAANLSHELRTPLTAIRTDAEMIGQAAAPEAVTRRGQRIVGAVDRIRALSESLLLLARDVQLATKETVRLRPRLDALWEEQVAAAGKSLVLACDVPEDAAVLADPALLDLVLRNLLDNAIRHSPEGAIACRLQGSRLSVCDTGQGFAPDELAQVFERFYSARPGGTGIGLALVRHACQASGWQATAANAAGGGGEVAVDFAASLTREAG